MSGREQLGQTQPPISPEFLPPLSHTLNWEGCSVRLCGPHKSLSRSLHHRSLFQWVSVHGSGLAASLTNAGGVLPLLPLLVTYLEPLPMGTHAQVPIKSNCDTAPAVGTGGVSPILHLLATLPFTGEVPHQQPRGRAKMPHPPSFSPIQWDIVGHDVYGFGPLDLVLSTGSRCGLFPGWYPMVPCISIQYVIWIKELCRLIKFIL